MSIINLKNNKICIGINTHGAELVSLVNNENQHEYMWCGDSKYWGRVSPILFPFVGKLEKQRYVHNEIVYENIPQHGFARDSEFELVEQTEDTVWFQLIKDETWKKNYPFEFVLRVGYRIEGKAVHVMWTVINNSNEEMHFSIGAHPAFACGGGLACYSLDMHTNKSEIECGLLNDNGVLGNDTVLLPIENGIVNLSDELFAKDALIMDGQGINTITLCDRSKTAILEVRFDAPQLGLWSPANAKAPFVCIEPWYGRCDKAGFNGTLSEREYSNRLASGHSFSKEYVIEVKQ